MYIYNYRYGFNGQEMDDEVAGDRNTYTAEFWEYDARIGRRFNMDPVPIVSFSKYATFGDNPIWFCDSKGDVFVVGKSQQSEDDIKSLVKNGNEKYINCDENNKVSINFGSLDEAAKEALLKSDEGLSLINDLAKANEKYLYEASDIALIRDKEGGKTTGFVYLDPLNTINASEYGKDGLDGRRDRPREGYDGQVIIHPDLKVEEQDAAGSILIKSRAATIFHELAENYERTTNKIDYLDKPASGSQKEKKGAHSLAIEREGKWHGKSKDPGNAFRVTPGGRPTPERIKQIQNEIKKYYGL